MSAKPLTKAEAKWLADLEKLLQSCPSNRLGAYTTGDTTLHIYDRDVSDAWLAVNHRARDVVDASEQHRRAGSQLGFISTGFQIDSCSG